MNRPDSQRSEPAREASDWHRLHLWQIQPVRDLAVIAGVVGLVVIGYWLRSVTVPLLIALALAYLFEPLVKRLTAHPRINRPMVAGGLVGAVALLFAALLIVLSLSLVQTVELLRTLPTAVDRIVQVIDERLPEPVGRRFIEDVGRLFVPQVEPAPDEPVDPAEPETEGEMIDDPPPDAPVDPALDEPRPYDLAEHLRQWLRANMGAVFTATVRTTGDALSFILGVIGSTLYLVFIAFLIPFYFFAFSTTWPQLRDYVVDVFPSQRAPRAYEMLGKMDRAVSGFVRGRIVISLLMGIMFALGWWMVGVPYWLPVGLITGLLCMVPFLGIIGVPVAVGLLWLAQLDLPEAQRMAWWGIVLWPTLVFTIVQLIESYGLTPWIAGKATNLGPVSILVAVLAGGVVAGAYGMLLAIPVAACLKIVLTDLLMPRVRDWSHGRASDPLPFE